jgi:hypothetical protein
VSLNPVEQVIGSIEDLSSLSIEELTELCFAQVEPEFHKNKEVIGYIPAGATYTIESFVDIRTLMREFHKIRSEHEYASAIGKLLMRRRLERAEVAKKIPKGASPIFAAAREFKNIYDLKTKRYRPYDEYFRIIDRKLVGGTGMTVMGSESSLYELRRNYEYSGQEGQTLSGERLSAYFMAGYPPELSPYDYYDDRPDRNTALIPEDELRALLIKWGELDRPVQLEIEAA